MNTTQAAVLFLAGTAITGIVSTAIQTERLQKAELKLRLAESKKNFFYRVYQDALDRMSPDTFAEHLKNAEEELKFTIITMNE